MPTTSNFPPHSTAINLPCIQNQISSSPHISSSKPKPYILFFLTYILSSNIKMKLLKLIFVLLFSVTLLFNATFSSSQETTSENVTHLEDDDEMEDTLFRGASRFLAQKKQKTLTCNKAPRICRSKGSLGPDCCMKKCVNVMTDRLNCGICGNKCKYGQICCRGNCVNPSFDKRNCGGCNKKCKKGEYCAYGMCSYA